MLAVEPAVPATEPVAEPVVLFVEPVAEPIILFAEPAVEPAVPFTEPSHITVSKAVSKGQTIPSVLLRYRKQ